MGTESKLLTAIGYWPLPDKNLEVARLKELEKYKDRIHDLHFAHYDPEIVSSGRLSRCDRSLLLGFIELAHETTDIQLTLLMNYLLHDDYDKVIRNFKEEFYPRGIRSVVIADIELIKRMKQAFPDVHIQGSCLSYRMTEDELYEEAKEGVEIHNPAVDIIRDSDQLRKNHEAGFKQKVIWAEGCMHKCPHERVEGGHRWHIARNLEWGRRGTDCSSLTVKDFKHFTRANWVTIDRLKELLPYIEVVKLPRKRNAEKSKLVRSYPPPKEHLLSLQGVTDFFHLFDSGEGYNVLDFNGVAYQDKLTRKYGAIPSTLFNREFFETVERCDGKCKELQCNMCYKIQERLERNSIRYKLKRDRGIIDD